MKQETPRLLLSTSPFLKSREDTRWIMWQVNFSLIPVVAASVIFFGIGALLILAACILGAALPEWLATRHSSRPGNLKDGSAILTGTLLALTLPPAIPLWMAFVGGAVSVLLGKMVFGGIGYNVFNPALVGRAFLQASFPVAMTTWPAGPHGLGSVSPALFTFPFARVEVDAVTSATPLALFKFSAESSPLSSLLLGTTGGSLGETSALLLLLCGAYLAARGVLNWRIPVSILGTTLLLGAIFYGLDSTRFADPFFQMFSGGLVLGAVYMATDPVTSPLTQRGCWIFGAGIALLVLIIRAYGGLPEGVMYAILLLNALTPLINRVTQPRIYGGESRRFRVPVRGGSR